jgi:serine/threonine protein kinase
MSIDLQGGEEIDCLLDTYEQHLVRGDALTAEHLCAQCPELLPEIQRRIAALRRFNEWDEPDGPPASIGQYRIDSFLGRGAMGEVYRAFHLALKRPVAIKLLVPSRMLSRESIARFNVELEALGRLGPHENVVWSMDGGTFEGRQYLVMEFIDGSTLANVVNTRGALPVETACNYLRQAALGLQYIHTRGMYHRDIKPSNLMLTRDGVVKVTDLGLALLREPLEGAVSDLTKSHSMIGTYLYMAPEQARDPHAINQCADIYSLGATFYKLLTGAAPFEEPGIDTSGKLLAAILGNCVARSVATLRPDVPVFLSDLVGQMLSKDPAARPSTAATVAAALEPYVTAGSTNSAITAPRRNWQNVRWAFCVAVILIIAVGLWITLFRSGEHHDDQSNEIARTVFKLGGRIEVIMNGGDKEEVGSVEGLPKANFRIDGIMINRAGVDEQFLEKLSNLRGLTLLDLTGCSVNDLGLSHLAKIQTLTFLDLKDTDVTSKGLAAIAGLKSLQRLKLSDTPVDDSTLAKFGELNRLRVLFLKRTNIGAGALHTIAKWTSLADLDLRENRIDDNDLTALLPLQNLGRLWLEDTKVSPSGIARLQQGLPKCEIFLKGAP